MINTIVNKSAAACWAARHGDAVLPHSLRHWIDGGDCRAGTRSGRSRRSAAGAANGQRVPAGIARDFGPMPTLWSPPALALATMTPP